jgi:hypothetical protein
MSDAADSLGQLAERLAENDPPPRCGSGPGLCPLCHHYETAGSAPLCPVCEAVVGA